MFFFCGGGGGGLLCIFFIFQLMDVGLVVFFFLTNYLSKRLYLATNELPDALIDICMFV